MLMRSPGSGTARPHRASKIGTSNNGTLREACPRSCLATLEHDPEKWEPVFGKRSCSNKELERDDDSKKNHPALVLLRHKCTAAHAPHYWSGAAWASRQSLDKSDQQSSSHCCNRVRDVTFRPQGQSLWVCNWRIPQASRATRWNKVPRGESSPARRSGSRTLRYITWHGDGTPSIRGLRNDRAQPPV